MRTRPDAFEEYLAPGESVVYQVPGRMVDGSNRAQGAVGITDDRLLFVADGNHFLDVARDSITSIRSTHQSGFTAPGLGYPLIAATGALVTLLGLLALVGLAPGTVGIGLALATVGGGVSAELLRRSDVSVDPRAVKSIRRAIRGDVTSRRRELRGVRPFLHGPFEGNHHYADGLVLGAALFSLLALVGLIAAAGTLAVVPLVLVSLGGFAVADVGYRRATALDDEDASRVTALDVQVDLVNGRTVEFRVDPEDRVDRALSTAVRSGGEEAERPVARPSTSGAASTQR